MRFQALLNRLDKLTQALLSKRLISALLRHRVLAGSEHRHILPKDLKTVIDIGANRGQFALAARRWAPQARIISFEPLNEPAAVFRRVFSGDDQVRLHQAAIGPETVTREMYVSARDDSSSLLPISSLQTTMFPGTEMKATTYVQVAPLNEFVTAADLQTPALLKLDVQGFEFDALKGCEPLLDRFAWVYCECSFVEFYAGQKLAADVKHWLAARGYNFVDMFNPTYDRHGQAVQADFLFVRQKTRQTTS